MVDRNKYPRMTSKEPVQVGKILDGILSAIEDKGVIDAHPGRTLAARLSNAEQHARVIGEEIEVARQEGGPTAKLDQEMHETNIAMHSIRQGFMPKQDTRPQ